MLHVLLNLPNDLAADIMSNWVSLVCTVRLDTACCNSTARPKFTSVLSSCILARPLQGCQRTNTDDLVGWAMKRMTRVSSLYINEASNLAMYEEFLANSGAAVSKIRLERRARSDVLSTTGLMNLVATHCNQLKELDWNGQGEGLDLALREVLLRCTQLNKLKVSASMMSMAGITPQSIEDLRCLNLHTLVLHCVYFAETVAAFIKMAPSVETLSLQMCLFQLQNGESALQYINPAVRSLQITTSQITDDDLIRIVDLCPHITSIDLSEGGIKGSLLTVRSIEYMAKHLTNLAKVNLSSPTLKDDSLLALVAHRAETLTSLDVVQCYDLSTTTINSTLRQCTKLTRFGSQFDRKSHALDFSLLANMTDLQFVVDSGPCATWLSNIAQHCRKLEHLLLDVLQELESTDELDTIVENCESIRTLKIRVEEYDCGGFLSEEKLSEWKLLRPQLEVTDGLIYG